MPECFDFKISMYVNWGGQGAGRREKKGSQTNNVMLANIYMSVKFFNFSDYHGYTGINRGKESPPVGNNTLRLEKFRTGKTVAHEV